MLGLFVPSVAEHLPLGCISVSGLSVAPFEYQSVLLPDSLFA